MTNDALKRSRGRITTFYSFKGGTGRSMALANIACLLAVEAREDILLIDWDLEAPGLHEYFHDHLPSGHKSKPGLMEFFLDADKALPEMPLDDVDEEALSKFFNGLDDYLLPLQLPGVKVKVWMLKAGHFDAQYAANVAGFDWQAFFRKIPVFFARFARLLYSRYQHILIDSRTGHTDTGGICTMLMPENLVLVFTPNNQSLKGVLELAKKATDYRRHSNDLRPLVIYPLPSRVETSEPERRAKWRKKYTEDFEYLFQEIYDLPKNISLKSYFDKAQIPHASRFAYGEEISVLIESTEDTLSLANSYQIVKQQLFGLESIWETKANGDKTNLFIAYSSRDSEFKDELMKHLSTLSYSGKVEIWEDSIIKPGQNWKREISQQLMKTDIILLLVSVDFFSSKYTQEELSIILEKHKQGETTVIPIILRPVDWGSSPLGNLQVLPKDGKPVSAFADRDEAFAQIAREIRNIIAHKPLRLVDKLLV